MARRRKGGHPTTKHDITVTTGSEFTWPDKLHGRKITFKIHPIRNGIQITRGGRRGGIRGEGKARGGMTVCTAEGERSKCIRAKDIIVFPGGGAALRRKKIAVLNGLGGRRRKGRR